MEKQIQLKDTYRRNRLPLGIRNMLIGLSFILPNFIGFFIFVLIPVFFSFTLSLMQWDGFTEMKFVGLSNFARLFTKEVFRSSLAHTMIFTGATVVLTTVISLALSIALNQKLKGINVFRSAIFFPYIASIVAVGAVWQQLFQPEFGPINLFLRLIGFSNPPGWLTSTKWALAGVIIVNVWRNMGYFMIVYLAALQDIPYELYESSDIDGATGWQKFRFVTVPMLSSATFFVVLMLTINSFKIFDLIYVMTGGGPGTSTTMLVNYIYDQAFVSWNYGAASAAAIVLFVIVCILTIFQFWYEKRTTDHMKK